MNKPILQSATTRSVAAATAAGTGTVLGVLAWLRGQGWLPWGEDQDEVVAVVVATVVVPLVSRWLKRAVDLYREVVQ